MVKQKFILLAALFLSAQQAMCEPVNKIVENTLHGSNKLMAVIAVLSIILIGIVLYLFVQEKQIRKLERELSEKNHDV